MRRPARAGADRVGVVCLEIADERLCELPGAEEIFKAGDEECAALLAELTPVRLASSRLKALEADTGETLGGEFGALFDWLAACLERGRRGGIRIPGFLLLNTAERFLTELAY